MRRHIFHTNDTSFRRAFWGLWGSKKQTEPSQKRSSVFAKIVPPAVNRLSTQSRNIPEGSKSISESLDPALVSAAFEATVTAQPDEKEQRLINAGLDMLEQIKFNDKYTPGQLQALDLAVSLVFSPNSTLCVYEEFQILADAFVAFSECDSSDNNKILKCLKEILSAFVPPNVVAVFEDINFSVDLPSEEERLAFVGCFRLVLGDSPEAIENLFSATPHETENGKSSILLVLSTYLHEACACASHDTAIAIDTRKLVTQMFSVLIEQVPSLSSRTSFVSFARNAPNLRLQYEFVQLLRKLFLAFDPEETGKISIEQLKSSLFRIAAPDKAEALLSGITPDENGQIEYHALLRVIQRTS